MLHNAKYFPAIRKSLFPNRLLDKNPEPIHTMKLGITMSIKSEQVETINRDRTQVFFSSKKLITMVKEGKEEMLLSLPDLENIQLYRQTNKSLNPLKLTPICRSTIEMTIIKFKS